MPSFIIYHLSLFKQLSLYQPLSHCDFHSTISAFNASALFCFVPFGYDCTFRLYGSVPLDKLKNLLWLLGPEYYNHPNDVILFIRALKLQFSNQLFFNLLKMCLVLLEIA